MTSEEMLDRVKRAAGPFTPLRELRKQLPTARSDQAPSERGPHRTRGAGIQPRGAGETAARGNVAPLTERQRELLIDQAVLMLEELYAHLPLKRALHAIDPIQRLRLLRLRHEALDEREFQSEMIDIFVGLRDLHTNYILPSVYHRKYRVPAVPRRGVLRGRASGSIWSPALSPRNTDAKLVPGVEVTHWNGMPIDLAVARNAGREAGSNLEARRARGLEALTLRWFGMSLPPDEDWVVLTYSDANGQSRIPLRSGT